jgi:hypothetical protein
LCIPIIAKEVKKENENKEDIEQKKNGNWFIGRGVSFYLDSEYLGG